jgi:hypothetical protein
MTILFLLGIISWNGTAEVVEDLYSASVQIADQSESLRAKGVQQGLSDVFVKLTGSRAILSDPGFSAIKARANEYLTEYGYSERPPENSSDTDLAPQVTTMLDVSFASAPIEKALRDLFLPIWPADRPAMVAWLIAPGEDGYEFIDPTHELDISSVVDGALNRRGVPFKTPLYDLQDHMALTPKQAWQVNEKRLTESSRRYGVDHWLILRVERQRNGNFKGAWFVGGNQQQLNGVVTAQSMKQFVVDSIDQAVDQFSTSLTYRAGQLGETVQLLIVGVSSLTDFTAVSDALANFEVVVSTRVKQIDKDQISLEILTESDATTLVEMLEKSRHFYRVVSMGGSTQASLIEFQWRGR